MPEIKQTFNADVLEKFKNAVEKCDNVEIKSDFQRIENEFKQHRHISDKVF